MASRTGSSSGGPEPDPRTPDNRRLQAYTISAPLSFVLARNVILIALLLGLLASGKESHEDLLQAHIKARTATLYKCNAKPRTRLPGNSTTPWQNGRWKVSLISANHSGDNPNRYRSQSGQKETGGH